MREFADPDDARQRRTLPERGAFAFGRPQASFRLSADVKSA